MNLGKRGKNESVWTEKNSQCGQFVGAIGVSILTVILTFEQFRPP
jgi:hypothetical protein